MKSHHKSDYIYTPLFCEENIWQLANTLINQGIDAETLNILFLSNPDRKIAVFNKLAAAPSESIIWDYHVILSSRINNRQYIFDFDSRLEFPTLKSEYFFHSFPASISIPEELQTYIRTVPAISFLQHFYSDRSHMKGIIDDDMFPQHPIIRPCIENKIIHLSSYWDMKTELDDGSVVEKLKY